MIPGLGVDSWWGVFYDCVVIFRVSFFCGEFTCADLGDQEFFGLGFWKFVGWVGNGELLFGHCVII